GFHAAWLSSESREVTELRLPRRSRASRRSRATVRGAAGSCSPRVNGAVGVATPFSPTATSARPTTTSGGVRTRFPSPATAADTTAPSAASCKALPTTMGEGNGMNGDGGVLFAPLLLLLREGSTCAGGAVVSI